MTREQQHAALNLNEGKTLLVLGDLITFKLTGADTNSGYLVVEITSQPGGGPSFLHTHPPQETFYILESVFEIYGQNEQGKYAIRAPVGSVVHVPANDPHGFKNIGNSPGRMLVVYEPPDIMLEFFDDIGILVKDISNPPVVGWCHRMWGIIGRWRGWQGLELN